MAISFSGQAPIAVELNGSTGRSDIPLRQLRAVDASDRNGVRPPVKPRPAKDDEFGTVLAALLTVSGNQLQLNPVAEKTATVPNLTSCETGVCESGTLSPFGPSETAAGAGERQTAANSMSPSNATENATGDEQVSAGLVGTEGLSAEAQATMGVAADVPRNGAGLSNSEQSSSIVASLLQPQVAQVRSEVGATGGPASTPLSPSEPIVEISSIPTSVNHSGASASHESLSQDAIDALDRIGRMTGDKTPEDFASEVPGDGPAVRDFTENAMAFSTEDGLSASPGSAAVLSVPASQLSAVTEFGLLKSPLSGAMPSAKADDETAALEETTPQETTDSVLPVKSTRLLAGQGLSAKEERLLSAVDALAELELNPGIAAREESITLRSQYRNAEIDAAKNPAAEPTFAARSEERKGDQPDSVTAGSGTTPGDVAQLYVANTFSEVATPLSGDVRHTLSGQVSQAVLHHIEHSGVRSNDSLTVRLDPPELGEMRIELSKTVDGLAVRVTACEALTMDMLLARGQEIESQLRNQQMDLKSLEFVRTDLSQNGFSQGQGQQQESNSSRRAENLMNQLRSGARNAGQAITSVPRNAVSDSTYGLSFRA